jgi:hypothetical protein
MILPRSGVGPDNRKVHGPYRAEEHAALVWLRSGANPNCSGLFRKTRGCRSRLKINLNGRLNPSSGSKRKPTNRARSSKRARSSLA